MLCKSNTSAISCEEPTHWKRPWCWERLRAGWEGDNRGWDGWMALPTRWTWVWVNSRSWWWTGRLGVLWFMGLQRVGHNWATEWNWLTDTYASVIVCENMCVCVCKHGELTCVCVICLQLEWDWERAWSQHSETIMNIFPEVSLCFRSWGVNTYFTK